MEKSKRNKTYVCMIYHILKEKMRLCILAVKQLEKEILKEDPAWQTVQL